MFNWLLLIMYHLIISDLHLNPFKIDIDQLNWLKSLYANPKISRITFNGDTWEGFGFKTPGKPRFDYFYKNWYLPFLKPLSQKKPTDFIPGNHDSLVWWNPKKIKFSQKVTVTYNKIPYLITHGHQYALKQNEGQITNFLLTSILGLIYSMSPKLVNGTIGRFFNYQAKRNISQQKQKNFIIGHTHFFEINPSRMFFNSGCNIFGNHNGLLIEIKTGKVLHLNAIC